MTLKKLRTRPNTRLIANVSAAVAAVFFGATIVAIRVVVEDFPPVSLAVARFGIGGALVVAVVAAARPRRLAMDNTDFPRLFLIGSVLFAVFPILGHKGLELTEASRGALMLATIPIWSVVLARAMVGERLSPRQLLGVLLTFVGVAAILAERGLGSGATSGLLGDALILAAAFGAALYGVVAQPLLAKYSPATVTGYSMLLGAAVLVPFAAIEGLGDAIGDLSGQTLWLVLFIAIPGSAIGFWLWTWSLAHLSPTRVAVYINVNPLVAAVLAALLLSETLAAVFVIGFAAVIAGVVLVNLPARTAVET